MFEQTLYHADFSLSLNGIGSFDNGGIVSMIYVPALPESLSLGNSVRNGYTTSFELNSSAQDLFTATYDPSVGYDTYRASYYITSIDIDGIVSSVPSLPDTPPSLVPLPVSGILALTSFGVLGIGAALRRLRNRNIIKHSKEDATRSL